MSRLIRTFIAGLLVVLPIALTVALVVWVGNLVYEFAGPNSVVGQLLSAIGFGVTASSAAAYGFGIAIVLACIYVLGLVVETSLQHRVSGAISAAMQRIPLIGNIYDLAKRFVALLDRKDGDGLKSMRPVWCFFGGDGGAAVLALLPSPEPIMLGGEPYQGILVPSAPVPIGGCLIYVPTKWITPAEMGIEALMSTYVTMGVSAPRLTR
jgi:uncharacterized membrane protein